MMPGITVAIYDNNRFFALGVQHILRAYFTDRGDTIKFTSSGKHAAVDLVVQAESAVGTLYPCRTLGHKWPPLTAVIVIQEPTKVRRKPKVPCLSELGELTRRDTTVAIVRLVEKILVSSRHQRLKATDTCRRCMPHLTPREQAVLWGVSWGLTPASLADMLSLNSKTVSAHKRNAMRKLGLQSNNELCLWFRQGGLNYVKNRFF